MKLSYKIYGIIAIFCVPLILTAIYFIIMGVNEEIAFALKEKKGDAFQRPLESLLDHLSQHQVASVRSLSGEAAMQPALATLRAQIDQDFDKLDESAKKYGQELGFTDAGLKFRKREQCNPGLVQKSWRELAAQADKLSVADCIQKHGDLISTVQAMIAHSGDNSFLILDPIMITYYTSSITLGDLPGEQGRMAGVVARAMTVLKNKKFEADDQMRLTVDAANLIETDVNNVAEHVKVAYQYDNTEEAYAATLIVSYGTQGKLKGNLQPAIDRFSTATTELSELLTKIAGSAQADTDVAKLQDAFDKARKESFALEDTALGQMDELLQIRADSYAQKRHYALFFTALAFLASLIVSFFMIRAITRSVENVAGELHDLSSGEANLTRRIGVTTSDEVGRLSTSFNSLMDKLLGFIRQIQKSGTQVSSSSNQIAASTKQLEAAVTEQAASTNEVVATTKEISATSQSLVQTMGDVGKVAQETSALAGSAQGELEGMEATMRQLTSATGSISTKLAAINDKTNNISKIVVTITKVADQTNLLSLNASIEAEKAGEHGLGFAVVAREIRRLADQTAVATLDIERMVKEMQSAVTNGVMEMDKFTRDVGQGVEEINHIGAQLTKIMERVQALAPRFESVTDGMQAQSLGAQQISTAMVQLSDAARQTMDSLRQTNSAIQELNSAARGLHSEVSRFKTSVD